MSPWIILHQAPLSMEFSRQDTAVGCHFLLHISVSVQFSSVLSLSHVQLFETPWTAAHQASLSITYPELTQTHIHRVGDAIQPSHPLSSPSPAAFNFPTSGPFQMSQLFASGGQSIGVSASASVLPMNIQD